MYIRVLFICFIVIFLFNEIVIRTKIQRVPVVQGLCHVEVECDLIGHRRPIPLLSHTMYIHGDYSIVY